MTEHDVSLRRSLSLPLVTFYGLGNILGAGIYVLTGKVAGYAGYALPFSFLVAALVAALTAFSYAELSSRYPLSAGEAVYVQEGLGIRHLSLVVGLLIILTGIVSAATIARGFTGYLDIFIRLPHWLTIVVLIMVMGALAIWGITESVRAVAVCTLIEIAGLVLILVIAAPLYKNIPELIPDFTAAVGIESWQGIFLGAFLAFYAYVGFEDMVNIAEEVKNVERNLPWAIILSLVISTVLYLGICLVSLLAIEPFILSKSDAPLADVYQQITGRQPLLISAISLFAVVNGALIQIVMAARVCYGLSRKHWLPKVLGVVNKRTRTPVTATILITAITIIMALWLPIETLARATSYFLLIIFALVNLSLWKIKRLQPAASKITFTVPAVLPATGLIACLLLLAVQTMAMLSGIS